MSSSLLLSPNPPTLPPLPQPQSGTSTENRHKTHFLKALAFFHAQEYKQALRHFLALYKVIGRAGTSMHVLSLEGNLGLLSCRFIGHCYFHLQNFSKAHEHYQRARLIAKALNRLEDEYRVDFHLLLLELRRMSGVLLEKEGLQLKSDIEIEMNAYDNTDSVLNGDGTDESTVDASLNSGTVSEEQKLLHQLKTFASTYLEKYWWNNVWDRSLLGKISLVIGMTICATLSPEKAAAVTDPSHVSSHIAVNILHTDKTPNATNASTLSGSTASGFAYQTPAQHTLIEFAEKSLQKSCKYFLQISKKRFAYKVNAMYSQFQLATLLQTHKRDYSKAIKLYVEVYDFFFGLLQKGKQSYADDEIEVDEDQERDLALLDDHLWLDPEAGKDLSPIESKEKNRLKRERKETMIDKEFNRFSMPCYEEILEQCAHRLEMCYILRGRGGDALRICESFKSHRMQLYLAQNAEKYERKEISVIAMKQHAVRLSATFLIYHVVAGGRLLLIWIVTPGESDCQCVSMPRESIQSMLPSAENDPLFVREVKLRELYKLLVQPVEHLMPDSPEQHLVIFPDINLLDIPYQALLNPETNRYLIEDHNICLCESFLFLEFSLALKGYSLSMDQHAMKYLLVKSAVDNDGDEEIQQKRKQLDDSLRSLSSTFESAALLRGMVDGEILQGNDLNLNKKLTTVLSSNVPFMIYLPDIELLPEKEPQSREEASRRPLFEMVSQIRLGGSKQACTIAEHDFSGSKCILLSADSRSMSMRDIFRLYHSFFVAGIPCMLVIDDQDKRQSKLLRRCLEDALNYGQAKSDERKAKESPELFKQVLSKNRPVQDRYRSISIDPERTRAKTAIPFAHCLRLAILEQMRERHSFDIDLLLSSVHFIGDPYGPFSQKIVKHKDNAITFESMNGKIDRMEPESIAFLKMHKKRLAEG